MAHYPEISGSEEPTIYHTRLFLKSLPDIGPSDNPFLFLTVHVNRTRKNQPEIEYRITTMKDAIRILCVTEIVAQLTINTLFGRGYISLVERTALLLQVKTVQLSSIDMGKRESGDVLGKEAFTAIRKSDVYQIGAARVRIRQVIQSLPVLA